MKKVDKKQKKYIKLLGLLAIVIGGGFTSMQAIYIENLPNNDMYTFVDHENALSELAQSCNVSINQKANIAAQQVNNNIGLKMNAMSSAHQFIYAHELYQRISSIYPTIFAMKQEQKCYYSNVLISLQSTLRDRNISLIEKNNILADFANISGGSQFNGDTFKHQLIEFFNQKHSNQAQNLPSNTRIPSPNISALKPTEKKLAQSLLQFSTNIIYKTINDMYQKKYINKIEAETLLKKIEITYVPDTCNTYHGNFSINYKVKNGIKINPSINAIKININGCYNIFVLAELESIIETLTLHEIGGHFSHYLKDNQRENFKNICRNNNESKKAACGSKDFVSEYSQSSALEDYAETFAYRWLKKLDANTPTLRKKKIYMDQLFQRMTK